MEADVIVVGGGPSGMSVASEPALAGVRVTVFEPYPAPAGAHPLTGQRVPDLELQTPNGLERIGEMLRGQDFLIIDCTGNGGYDELTLPGAPIRAISGVPTSPPENLREVRTLLVRPDAYLAWVDSGPSDPALARDEVARWLDPVR